MTSRPTVKHSFLWVRSPFFSSCILILLTFLIENNPEVFSHLVHHLGVAPTLGFYDVYSLDSPDLLAIIPRPAYAVIFICPAAVYFKARKVENDVMKAY